MPAPMRNSLLAAATIAAALLNAQSVQAATAAAQPHAVITDLAASTSNLVEVRRGWGGGGGWGRGGGWGLAEEVTGAEEAWVAAAGAAEAGVAEALSVEAGVAEAAGCRRGWGGGHRALWSVEAGASSRLGLGWWVACLWLWLRGWLPVRLSVDLPLGLCSLRRLRIGYTARQS